MANQPTDLIIVLGIIAFRESAETVDASDRAVSGNAPTTPEPSAIPALWSIAELASIAACAPVACVSPQQPVSDQWLQLLRAGVRDLQAQVSGPQVVALIAQIRSQQHRSQQVQHSHHYSDYYSDYLQQLQQDQRAGHQVQLGMLPPSPMAIGHYRLRHQIWPSLMLSGDFVDYFELDANQFAFYVADVAGHGASSAFVTVLLKNFSRRLRREIVPSMMNQPGEVLEWLNHELLDNELGKHVAILFGVVNTATNELRLANAGHFPPAMLVRSGQAEFVEQAGKPAGLFPQVSYSSKTLDLLVGDHLVVVSDGVFEQLNSDDSAVQSLATKEDRVLRAAEHSGDDMASFWERLACDPENPTTDDVTWFVLTREA